MFLHVAWSIFHTYTTSCRYTVIVILQLEIENDFYLELELSKWDFPAEEPELIKELSNTALLL